MGRKKTEGRVLEILENHQVAGISGSSLACTCETEYVGSYFTPRIRWRSAEWFPKHLAKVISKGLHRG